MGLKLSFSHSSGTELSRLAMRLEQSISGVQRPALIGRFSSPNTPDIFSQELASIPLKRSLAHLKPKSGLSAFRSFQTLYNQSPVFSLDTSIPKRNHAFPQLRLTRGAGPVKGQLQGFHGRQWPPRLGATSWRSQPQSRSA